MVKKNKLRFNLARGKNYMKWKLNKSDGSVVYLNPCDVQLILHNCVLKNNKKQAEAIYNGKHKVVCAWILCDKVEINISDFNQSDVYGNRIKFNPRVNPHWVMGEDSLDIDMSHHDRIETVDFKLYSVN